MKYISPLQYITQGGTIKEIEQQVRNVLTGGCDWIQLRMKGSSDKEFLEAAKRVKELCYAYNATFIINDNVQVAIDINADGVHLGKGDMPTSIVREWAGKGLIIGRTANTARDIEILSNQKIDYIGLGPYRHTNTKENLSDILGIEGYTALFTKLNELGVTPPPIVAIGGITLEDIEPLSQVSSLSGVAISGSIAFAENVIATTREHISAVEKNFNIKNYNLKG